MPVPSSAMVIVGCAAMTAPSTTAGLSSSPVTDAANVSACSMSSAMSAPASAAGTSPNAVSAE